MLCSLCCKDALYIINVRYIDCFKTHINTCFQALNLTCVYQWWLNVYTTSLFNNHMANLSSLQVYFWVCNHVASDLDCHALICAICDLPSGLGGGSCWVPPWMVYQRHSQCSKRRKRYRRATRGQEIRRIDGSGQHTGHQPEGQTGIHPKSGTGKKSTGEELSVKSCKITTWWTTA